LSTREATSNVGIHLTPEEQTERATFSPIKFCKGSQKAAQRAHELFGVEVSEHFIRRATFRKKNRLGHRVIGGVAHYSDQHLYDFFIVGTRHTETQSA
jgi:hypothetical protein